MHGAGRVPGAPGFLLDSLEVMLNSLRRSSMMAMALCAQALASVGSLLACVAH
jgi:hypothetical protein